MRIRDKISIPFILLAIAGFSLTALLSVNLVTRVLEQRFERQLMVTSELLSQAGFGRNPVVLERVKAIIDADLLTVEGGEAVASTLDSSAEAEWMAFFDRLEEGGAGAPSGSPVVRYTELGDRPYTIAFRPLADGSEAAVAILKETSDVVQARQAVTKPIVFK